MSLPFLDLDTAPFLDLPLSFPVLPLAFPLPFHRPTAGRLQHDALRTNTAFRLCFHCSSLVSPLPFTASCVYFHCLSLPFACVSTAFRLCFHCLSSLRPCLRLRSGSTMLYACHLVACMVKEATAIHCDKHGERRGARAKEHTEERRGEAHRRRGAARCKSKKGHTEETEQMTQLAETDRASTESSRGQGWRGHVSIWLRRFQPAQRVAGAFSKNKDPRSAISPVNLRDHCRTNSESWVISVVLHRHARYGRADRHEVCTWPCAESPSQPAQWRLDREGGNHRAFLKGSL